MSSCVGMSQTIILDIILLLLYLLRKIYDMPIVCLPMIVDTDITGFCESFV